MILPDSSLWIEYLRAGSSTPSSSGDATATQELDTLIEREQVFTCGPVVAELLAGARGEQREELAKQLSGQPWVDLERADWLAVGRAAAALRERGQTTPLVDVQIAVCAVKANAELWTFDRDFERVGEVLEDLRLRML